MTKKEQEQKINTSDNDEKIEQADKVEFKGKYAKAIGRRKTSVAQVRMYKNGKGNIVINDKKASQYFEAGNVLIVNQPLKLTGLNRDLDFSILVKGGGKKAQAEAVRHGIVKSLVAFNEELKDSLKAKGWLTRDSRKKERKKPGLKKARRAPQWSKR